MSSQPAAHIKVGSDGRRITPEGLARMQAGRDKGRLAIIEAHALRRASISIQQDPQSLEATLKPSALLHTPDILKRWIKGALGRLKGWPATAQLEAGKLVFAVAGIDLESRARGTGPLSEMTLQELHDSLAESLDSARNMLALENTALQAPDSIDSECPNQGNSEPSEAIESEPVDARAAELPADEPT